jgi:hypothetical protein
MPLPVECWPDAPLNASLQRIALQFVSGAAVSEAKRLQHFARQCGQRLQRFTSRPENAQFAILPVDVVSALGTSIRASEIPG